MMRYCLKFTWLLLLILGMASCAETDSAVKVNMDSKLVLTIKTPGAFSSSRASSRGLTTAQENHINDVWVLVFNDTDNMLTDIRKGENLTENADATHSVSVKIAASKGDNDKLRLVVFANAEEILIPCIGTDIEDIANVDREYSKIIARINQKIEEKMYSDGGAIPMCGESSAQVVKSAGGTISMKVMRAIARIDVGVGLPLFDARTGTYIWSGLDAKDVKIPFEMTDIYLVKPNNSYAVVPNPLNLRESKVVSPTIPFGTEAFSLEESMLKFQFTGSDIVASTDDAGSYTTQSIYLPESDVKMKADEAMSGDENHENRMAVIVGGYYNGSSKVTYYRMDFAIGGEIIDVLRNHLYQFNIKSVSGAGYDDAEVAYRSKSMNMQIEVLEWDETDMKDIVFDGQYYFSVEKSELSFTPMGDEVQSVKIKTNVDDFEMYESQEDGTELSRMQVSKGVSTFKNEDMGYEYELIHNSDDIYTLKVKATKHNVSQTVPDRKNKWKFRAKRLHMPFIVDQQYTILYISYINGASVTLYPEGTTGDIKIPIEIMALVPVKIKSDDWIDVGMTDVPNIRGLYTARIDVKVAQFPFGGSEVNRVGSITVSPEGELPRVFNITQEAPILKLARTEEVVPRRGVGYEYKTFAEVITNIRKEDLTIARSAEEGEGSERIQHDTRFYNVDNTRPRYVRFDLTADMTRTEPIPMGSFNAEFSVKADAKYGVSPEPSIKLTVNEQDLIFNWFWYSSVIPPSGWLAPNEDDSRNYIFPWNTTSTTVNLKTTLGAEYDPSHMGNLPGKGSVTLGKIDNAPDGSEIYPFIYTFGNDNYNTVKDFRLYFRSGPGSPKTLVNDVQFKQGSQLWSHRSMIPNSLGFQGIVQGSDSRIEVINNIEWSAYLDSWIPTTMENWLTLRCGDSGEWVSPTEYSPIKSDDRLIAPKAYEMTKPGEANALLTKVTPIYIGAEPYMHFNGTPTTRSARINFVNDSFDEGKGGVLISDAHITLTQYAPILQYVSGAPSSQISYSGGSYTIRVNTNLQDWGVKVYKGTDNSGSVLINKVFGPSPIIPNSEATARSVSVSVPKNRDYTDALPYRNLTFYLYSTSQTPNKATEILIGSTQRQPMGIEAAGIIWAEGNLVYNGSTSCTIGGPGDCGLYFKRGSLVGWAGGVSGDGRGPTRASNSNSIYTKPSSYPAPKWGSCNLISTSSSIPLSSSPSSGTGDACRYYLGGQWRLPTISEYQALLGGITKDTKLSTNVPPYAGSSTYGGGPVVYVNYGRSGGTFYFPRCGWRHNLTTGDIWNPEDWGYYWASSSGTSSMVDFEYNKIVWRKPNGGIGTPLRCVRNR